MMIIARILLAIVILLIVLYASSPLYLPGIDKRVNKIDKKSDYSGTKEALDFHSTLFITDLHADPLFSYRNLLKSSGTGHMDIPRLIDGNIRLQVFGTPTLIPMSANVDRNDQKFELGGFLAFLQHWPVNTWYSRKNRALYQQKKLHDLERESKGVFKIIKTAEELEEYYHRSKTKPDSTAGLLALEGAHVMKNIPEDIDQLFDRGFRIIGVTHLTDNHLGGSAHGVDKGGLTEFGKKALKRMEELSMIIDLAHASPELMEDVLSIFSGRVMVSHTGVKGCINNNRNLTDQQILAIASKGGLIGIGFWEEAVGDKGAVSIVNAIKYTADLVGIKHVALGSDFDGGVTVPFDAAGMVQITEELMKRGFSTEEIRRIMGQNALDFLLQALPK